MVYLAAFDKYVICPPKNGTHTIHYVSDRVRGKPELRGHKTAGSIVGRLGRAPQFGMTVRDPVDRFLSMVNYFHKSMPELERNEPELLWASFEKVKGEFWALPQAHWCRDWETTFFPFEGLPIVRWMGWKGEIPHLHPTPKKTWDKARIEPILDRVMEHFEEDYALRDKTSQHP